MQSIVRYVNNADKMFIIILDNKKKENYAVRHVNDDFIFFFAAFIL